MTIFQLFFWASAKAEAATFFAVSMLIGRLYGLGACDIPEAAHTQRITVYK